jgi:hypothetical protein
MELEIKQLYTVLSRAMHGCTVAAALSRFDPTFVPAAAAVVRCLNHPRGETCTPVDPPEVGSFWTGLIALSPTGCSFGWVTVSLPSTKFELPQLIPSYICDRVPATAFRN